MIARTTSRGPEKAGDYPGAIRSYRAAVDIFSRWLGPKDPQIADAEIALGEAMDIAGNAKEALPLLEGALRVEKTLWSDTSAPVARAHSALGLTEANVGDRHKARLYLLQALAAYRALDPNGSARTGTALYHLAQFDLDDHRYLAAESEAREALAMDTKFVGPDDVFTLRSLLTLAMILKAEHHDAEANSLSSQACGNPVSVESEEARSRVCAEFKRH